MNCVEQVEKSKAKDKLKLAQQKHGAQQQSTKKCKSSEKLMTSKIADQPTSSSTNISDDSGVPSPTASLTSPQVWVPGAGQPQFMSSQASVATECSGRSTVSGYSLSEWPLTSGEKLMTKFNFKADLSSYHQRLDSAFSLISSNSAESVDHGLSLLRQIMTEAWKSQENAPDVVDSLCRYFQKSGALKAAVNLFVSGRYDLRLQTGQTLEAYLSCENAFYVLHQGYLKEVIRTIIEECDKKDEPHMCLGMALLEAFFRNGCQLCKEIVDAGGLDYLLDVCRTQLSVEALLHAAVALSNLAIFSDLELHRIMVSKQVPAWLFILATHDDSRIQYYGCLSSAIIGANKEFEKSVREAGTLKVAVTFARSVKPRHMARTEYFYRCGRSKEWMSALNPLLSSAAPEIQALALYQLNMEAILRKGTERIEVLQQLGYMEKVQDLVSCPTMDLVGQLAEQLLVMLGEPIPYKLGLSVPTWNCKDVQYWVRKIGFGHFAEAFNRHRVDGDLLLRTRDEHLLNEIKMTSAYERMRFERELRSLKRYADYSAIDPTRLDMWLTRLDQDLSTYTYQMLINGVDRNTLIHVDDACLESDVCCMTNRIHRTKLIHALREVKHVEEAELALLRKQVDIFISYRRATGSQLASLIKVHLQLKGFKVFIDVDRLNAGQFDKSLLLNIKAAKHFVLVLTPHALDACIGDHDCKDWVHTEIKTALEAKANIIPIVEKSFLWPPVNSLPMDMQAVSAFNAVQWVHEYQEACVEKLHKFLNGQTVERSGQVVQAQSPGMNN